MLKYLLIGIICVSATVFASEPMYKVKDDVYVKQVYDNVNDSYTYIIWKKNWTGQFTYKLDPDVPGFESLRKIGLTPLSMWKDKSDNWRVCVCKYNEPTTERTRCIIYQPYENITVANTKIIVDFVVEKDLPTDIIPPQDVTKKEPIVEIVAKSTDPTFDQDFSDYFINSRNK